MGCLRRRFSALPVAGGVGRLCTVAVVSLSLAMLVVREALPSKDRSHAPAWERAPDAPASCRLGRTGPWHVMSQQKNRRLRVQFSHPKDAGASRLRPHAGAWERSAASGRGGLFSSLRPSTNPTPAGNVEEMWKSANRRKEGGSGRNGCGRKEAER